MKLTFDFGTGVSFADLLGNLTKLRRAIVVAIWAQDGLAMVSWQPGYPRERILLVDIV